MIIHFIVILHFLEPSWAKLPWEETPEQKLVRLTPFIGESAAAYVRTYRLSQLENCTINDNPIDPDVEHTGVSASPRVSAYREVYEFGGNTTDRNANNGIISYMAASVVGQQQFFRAAFRFYQWLSEADLTWRDQNSANLNPSMEKGPSPINVLPAANLHAKALEYASGNQYLALKIMSLYGHDNLANDLYSKNSDCRAKIMDLIKPSNTSQLYHSGAIGGVQYSATQSSNGTTVAGNCQTAFTALESTNHEWAREFRYMCNDGYHQYQSDYYHVIASAFITCRGEIANRHASQVGTVAIGPTGTALVDSATTASRQVAIRAYKIARFKEEVARSSLPTRIKTYLNYALAKIGVGLDPFDTAWGVLRTILTPTESAMIEATVNRYRHEVQFRVYQNGLGSQYAVSSCQQQHYLNIDGTVGEHTPNRTGGGDKALPASPVNPNNGQQR